MAFLEVLGVAADATEIDIQSAPPSPLAKGRKWETLKTVPKAGLDVGASGGLLVPISGGDDAPGRHFRSASVRIEGNGDRTVSAWSSSDYHNRAPYTAGAVKLNIPQSAKEPCRTDLAPYLFDEDAAGGKMVIVSRKEGTAGVEWLGGSFSAPSRIEVFSWATLEGTVLVVDASQARVESRLTISLADEKGAESTLDVIVTVLSATAPAAPTGVVYVP